MSKKHKTPLIGVRNSTSLPIIARRVKTKALFVSRFSPDVTSTDIENSLKEQLLLKSLVCTRLKTKFSTYVSFHVSVTEEVFPLIKETVWTVMTWLKDQSSLGSYCEHENERPAVQSSV